MMKTTPDTIAELAVAMPQSISILEKLGIDYCCNGQQTVERACRANGITTDELLSLINAAPAPAGEDRRWDGEPMFEHEILGLAEILGRPRTTNVSKSSRTRGRR